MEKRDSDKGKAPETRQEGIGESANLNRYESPRVQLPSIRVIQEFSNLDFSSSDPWDYHGHHSVEPGLYQALDCSNHQDREFAKQGLEAQSFTNYIDNCERRNINREFKAKYQDYSQRYATAPTSADPSGDPRKALPHHYPITHDSSYSPLAVDFQYASKIIQSPSSIQLPQTSLSYQPTSPIPHEFPQSALLPNTNFEYKPKYNPTSPRTVERRHRNNHIPRPCNAFMLYRRDHQRIIKENNPELDNNTISKIIGKQWREEDESVKHEYFLKSRAEKRRHEEKYPFYMYQPKRRKNQSERVDRSDENEGTDSWMETDMVNDDPG